MSSLSERLAALNRTSERGRRLRRTRAAPKRRADVPTDAPPHDDATARSPARSRQPEPRRAASGHACGRTPGAAPPGRSRPGSLAAAAGPSSPGGRPGATATASARPSAAKDRFEDLKESVHSELLQQLGPQLYDANLEPPSSSPRCAPSSPTCWPPPTGR